MAVNINCNLKSVTKRTSSCSKPMFSGTGDRIYVFNIDDFVGEDGEYLSPTAGMYDASAVAGALSNKCFAIDIKQDSGQVTSEKAEGSDFRQITATAIVDHSQDEFMAIDRAIAGSNVGVLIPDNSGSFYVVASPFGKETKYTSNFDSGTTYDSDHGFTITFVVSPVYSGCPRVDFSGLQYFSLSSLLNGYTRPTPPLRPESPEEP